MLEAAGPVRVLRGTVHFFTQTTRQGGGDVQVLTPGVDSEGNEFDHGTISYPNDKVSGIITSFMGDTIGFDNTGGFVTQGNLDGFLHHTVGTDIYFVYGVDLDSLVLHHPPQIAEDVGLSCLVANFLGQIQTSLHISSSGSQVTQLLKHSPPTVPDVDLLPAVADGLLDGQCLRKVPLGLAIVSLLTRGQG